MITSLLILIASAVLCLLLGAWARSARLARLAGVGGALMALAVSLWVEGLGGSGSPVEWPSLLSWVGISPFTSDALSAGLGAWCLLLGGLCLLRVGSDANPSIEQAAALLSLAVVYSLVHTSNLLAFAGQVFLLALLVWAFYLVSGEQDARTERSTLSLGLGGLFLLGAAFLIGRTTGGEYDLGELSLSALTVWPLVLFTAFVVTWLGMTPLTGWSGLVPSGGFGTAIHSLFLGVPVLALLLRLQGLVTEGAVGATLPASWEGFTQSVSWFGGITAVVSAAGMVVWVGKSRWPALQAAFWLGITLWALGLDTPLARYAALVMLLAYGGGRVAVELLPRVDASNVVRLLRIFANASLAGVPLTPGFVGAWLLGQAVMVEARPALAIALIGAVVLAACGSALQAGSRSGIFTEQAQYPPYIRWAGIAVAVGLVLAGPLISIWSPYVEDIVAIAGGRPRMERMWAGLSLESGAMPLLLMACAVALVVGTGWLVAGAVRSRTPITGVLLPTAIERLSGADAEGKSNTTTDMSALLENSPSPVWWLSLAWLDRGVYGFGSLLRRTASRFGGLLGRLEGRFYLPLSLILTLAALLAVTR